MATNNIVFAFLRKDLMDKEVSLLFALLRNALFQMPLLPKDWEDVNWNELYRLIKSHALQTLVAEPLMTLPDNLRPVALIQELLQLMAMNISEHVRLNSDVVKVFRLLSDKGFYPILMKGQGNATFYPKPLLRKCGDVDIYIGEKDYDAVCQLLIHREKGFVADHETYKHYDIKYGQTELEIHRCSEIATSPQNNDEYQRLVNAYFSRPDYVKIADADIPIPPHQFLPIYVFYHLWHHLKKGGVGIRQFCDMAAILHQLHGKIDLDRMKADLKSINLLKEWQLAGSIIVDKLGLPSDEYPFYKSIAKLRQQALLKLVVDDGNFASNRHYAYKTKFLLIKKTRSLMINIPRYWCMLKMDPVMTLGIVGSSFKEGIDEVLTRKDA